MYKVIIIVNFLLTIKNVYYVKKKKEESDCTSRLLGHSK